MRIWSGLVHSQAGFNDLAKLVGGCARASIRGMLILLKLDGQRASAFDRHRQADLSAGVEQSRPTQAVPLNRWVRGGILTQVQLTILDEQDRMHDCRWNFIELLEDASTGKRTVEQLSVPRANTKTVRLFRIRRVDSPAYEPLQLRRESSLFRNVVTRGSQTADELRNLSVSTESVKRTARGKGDLLTRTGFDAERGGAGVGRKQSRLKRGGPNFISCSDQ